MESVCVEVLGSLRLRGDDRLRRSAKLRRLFAVLVAHRGTVVAADRLAQAVWGDQQPADAAAALQTLAWRLREAVRAAGCDGSLQLRTRAPGYLLEVVGDQVDAGRFERLVTEARTRLDEAPGEAARLLDEGLALWRGPAYAEFADDEFAQVEAARLEQLRLAARSDWIEATLALGRPELAIERLRPLVAEHPLWERGLAQLMLALHRSGRSPAALAAFREYRDRLGAELGLDPSRELRGLEAAIIRRDDELEHRSAHPRPPPSAEPVGNLPHPLTDLIGRAGDAEAVSAALGDTRIVTLVGVGGVGKTRLALRVAAETRAGYPDGVWVCELAAVRDGASVPDTVASTLGVQGRQGVTVADRLVEYLRPKRLLLVVDNCEHVLDEAAGLIHTLASGCSGLTVLATSRQPLDMPGERLWPVLPLPVPPAQPGDPSVLADVPSVRLLVARAEAASPSFVLSETNAGAVSEVCRRLDGLPLALELAATRVRSMAIEEIADRLDGRLRFLRSTRRIGEERHRAIRSVVDWSYRLLTTAERTLFDRVSVFAGPFTCAAAAEVGGAGLDPLDVADLLTALVNKSMLVAHPEPPPSRFSQLETLRAYGFEQLARRGEAEATHRAHAHYHVELAEAADAGLRGPDEAHWARVLAMTLDDLRSAHQWALRHEPGLAVRLSAALIRYGDCGAPSEIFTWAEQAVTATEADSRADPPPALLAMALTTAAGVRRQGDLAGTSSFTRRALDLVTDPGDPLRYYPIFALGDLALFEGRLDEAARLYAETAELAEVAGDHYYVGYATAGQAFTTAYLGDLPTALTLARHAMRCARATGNPTLRAWANFALGETLHEQDPARALAALEDGLAAGRAAGNRFALGATLVSAASLHTRHGDSRQAVRLFEEAIEHWSQLGQWTNQWITLRNVVGLLVRLDAPEPAVVLAAASESSGTAAPAFGADAERLAAHLSSLRRQLGEDRFAAAVARGRTIPDDDAVALARACLAQLT